MFQVKQNESTASRKRLPIMLVDLTDGFTAEVGVTSPTISVSKNGAAAASGTGSFVEIGLGQYYYEFDAGEIDTLGWTAVYVIKTGTTRAYNAIVQIMAYDYAAGTNLGLSSLPTAAIGATGALLTSYTSNGALDVTATGAVNNVETVVNGVTLTAGTGSSVAQDVWNYDISGIGATNLAGGALEAAAGGTAGAGCSSAVEIAQEVWNYDLTAFTPSTYPGLAGDKLNNADNYVWNYNIFALSSPGSMAGGYLIDISTWTAFVYNSWGEVAAIPDAVWGYNTFGISEDTAGYQLNTAAGLGASIAEIPNNVWSTDISGYTSPSAGYELLNAGAGVSSALSDADAAGLRYRLGLDGTATAPSATGNLGVNSGSINSVTTVSGNVLGNVAGNVSGNIEGNLDGIVNAINSISQPAIQTIWQYEEVGIGLTSSIGYRLKTNVDAQISAVDNNVWAFNTGTGASAAAQLNAAAVAGSGGSSPAQIAQAVWAYNTGTGASAAAQLNSSTAGSVWNYSISWGDGNVAGYYLGNAIPGLIDITIGQTTNIAGEVFGDTIVNISGDPIYGPESAGFFLYNAGLSATSASSIAQNVWNYNTGTGASAAAQLNAAAAGSGGSSALDIAQTVWGLDISSYTSPSAGYELLNAGAGSGGSSAQEIAAAVWDANVVGVGDTTSAAYYLANTLYTAGNIEVYVQNQTPQDIWSYSGLEGRTITGGTGVTLATALPSNFSLLSINGSGQVTTSNPGTGSSTPTEIANAVWSTLTAPYTTHATFGHQILRSDNAATIGEVTLHQSGGSKRIDADVHAFVNNTASATAMLNILTGIGSTITGNIVGSIDTVVNDVNISTASVDAIWTEDVSGYTSPSAGYDLANAGAGSGGSSSVEIAGEVWSYVTREITGGIIDTNNDKTGYDLNQSFPSNFSDLAITAASGLVTTSNPGTGSTASPQDVANAVWEADPAYHNNNSTFGKAILRSDNSNVTGLVTMWSGASYNGVMADAYRIDESYDAAINLKNVLTGIGATVTGNIVGSVDTVVNDVNISTSSVDAIWNEDISGYTSPSAGYDLANVSAGSGGSSAVEIADAVWSYDISTGPASPSASYYINNIDTSATSAASDASTAASNTSDIGGTVWGYDPTALTAPQAGAILTDIQTDTNSIITDIGNVPNNVWASDVSGYSNPGEAGYELMNAGAGSGNSAEVASAVWSFATKDITGGTIDTNNDKTGYDLNQSFPSNFSTLSINGSGQVTTSNPGTGSSSGTEIASAVWSAGSRTVTGGSNITLASGQVPTNFTTLNIDGSGKVSVQAADISTIKSGLSTLTQAQVGTEVDSSLSDVGLTTVVTGRIDAAISSRLASASAPVNFSTLSINGSGEVTTSNPGTGASATQIASAVWTANRASIGASDGQFGYYLNAPVSTAGGTVTQVMLGPFALAATDGNNGYLNVFVDDERPVELVITDQNGNAIPLDTNNTHSVLVYDSGSTLVATYTGTVEYEAGGLVSFPLDADVTATAGSYKVVFDIDNGLTISKYGGLTILVRLC